MPRAGDPYPRANRRLRILSKSTPGAPSFVGRIRNATEGKRSIRRLIKRDPAKGTSQPFADDITSTRMANQPIQTPSPTIVSKSKTAAPGAGVSRIRNRGVNRTIKKN